MWPLGYQHLPTAFVLERRVDPPRYNRLTGKNDIEFVTVIAYNYLGRARIVADYGWLQERHPQEDYRMVTVASDGFRKPQKSTRERFLDTLAAETAAAAAEGKGEP